jgi:hypothetical protein
MSDETFLTRWSRLKREQATQELTPEPAPIAPVDPVSLPAVESLGPGSEVGMFLNQGVPVELARAALRSAWKSDPAVRGFIEIADNQWDFNVPDAIPGFGAMGEAEQAHRLAADALKIGTSLPNLAPPPERRVVQGEMSDESRVIDPVWQPGSISTAEPERPTPDSGEQPQSVDNSTTPVKRRHGGALPR